VQVSARRIWFHLAASQTDTVRWTRGPDGWFVPWICEWQLRHALLPTQTDAGTPGSVWWRPCWWHGWQSCVMRAWRILGLFEPCALWQVRQPSRTGECSQRNGSRRFWWHV
jgi:hypothetical protein